MCRGADKSSLAKFVSAHSVDVARSTITLSVFYRCRHITALACPAVCTRFLVDAGDRARRVVHKAHPITGGRSQTVNILWRETKAGPEIIPTARQHPRLARQNFASS